MLDLDPGMMIWAWAAFLALLFLLYKVAWKPIFSVIEKREQTIQNSLDKASKANEEAQVLLQKHAEIMNTAQGEAQQIIKENRELAEKSRQGIIEQAKNSAQKKV